MYEAVFSDEFKKQLKKLKNKETKTGRNVKIMNPIRFGERNKYAANVSFARALSAIYTLRLQ